MQKMSEPSRDSGAGEKEKKESISKSPDQEIEDLTTKFTVAAKIDEGTQIQPTEVQGGEAPPSQRNKSCAVKKELTRNGRSQSVQPSQHSKSLSVKKELKRSKSLEPSQHYKKELTSFRIYAYTLPPKMNQLEILNSPKLVKVGHTTETLARRFGPPRSAWFKTGICDEFLTVGSGRCRGNYKELFINAEISVKDHQSEVDNTEAVTRYLLGQPVTVAYVKRRLEELKKDEYVLHTLLVGGCGFTEWVLCSQAKIDALKEDMEKDKIVSKEEVHESSTAFLKRLKRVLEPHT